MKEKDLRILAIASEHHYRCRCAVCLKWWVLMGADENGLYGPFSLKEIREGKTPNEEPVIPGQSMLRR